MICDDDIAIEIVDCFDKEFDVDVIINALDFDVKVFRKTICFDKKFDYDETIVDEKDESNFLDMTIANFYLKDMKNNVRRFDKYVV